MKDTRKRIRCKQCKKRTNLAYSINQNKIRFTCPNCLSQGEFEIRRKL